MLNDALLACQEESDPAKFDPNPASPITARAYLAFVCGAFLLSDRRISKTTPIFAGIMGLNSCTSVDNAGPHSHPFAGSEDR